MAVTSHDVARLAGVSQPTVSRALRDSRGVSAPTRRKVREAARALGYVPIQSGRALSTQSTGRVGIVSAELTNPFYPAIIEPLHDRLADAGYRTILITDRGEAPVEVEPLIDGSLDGVIVTTSTLSSSLPEELRRRGVPCVLVNRAVDTVGVDRCVSDNLEGGAMVADFLLDLGHRRIAAIFGPGTTSTGHERAVSFQQRLADRGAAMPSSLVREVAYSAENGRTALLGLLAEQPSAVFCGNDVLAFGALNAAAASGIDVPRDLTVVGWDDIPMAAWEVFDLTTVRSDLHDMADRAVDLLVHRMENPDVPSRSVVVAPRLVLRGTHAPQQV